MGDTDSYNMQKAKRFAQQYPTIALKNAHTMLSAMRMVKDEDEIKTLERAIAITDQGLRRVLATLEPGRMEYQQQAEFEYEIRMRGAERVSFPTIAGSGINGCMLHYGTNHCKLEDGKLLLLDLGARVEGYCADITRTYPISGKYSPRQKEIYDIVLRANRAVAEAARPGVTLRELNDLCKKVLAEGMMAIGKIQSAGITCTAFPTIWGWTRTTAPFARIWVCARAWSSATSRGCISTRRKSVSASRMIC